MYRVFQKELYNDVQWYSISVWRVLRKRLHLKAYKLSVVQYLERWIVCTLSLNVFVTLTTQQYLEYQCKALFETLCFNSGSHIKP
jgi:hypothetical protein